jgi:hypothetical protein
LELMPGKVALPSGALWLAAGSALLVAGVNLGHDWPRRGRGEPAPLFDGGAHRRLAALVEALRPRTVVLLAEAARAPAAGRALAGAWSRPRPLIVDEWRHGDVVALHGDRPRAPVPRGRILVFGHLHPVVTLEDRTGAARPFPAFLRSRRTIVLPSFSPAAGGVDVSRGIPGELRELLGRGPVQVAVCTGKRVILVSA